MLRLVEQGAKTVFVITDRVADLEEYLGNHFSCEPMENLFDNYLIGADGCIVGILEDEKGTLKRCVQIGEPAAAVLGQLAGTDACGLVKTVITPPPVILFNSLGETAPVIQKIQKEFQGEILKLDEIRNKNRMNGVLLLFLETDGIAGKKLGKEALFIRQDFDSTQEYLRIHAPRYLAKAFEPDIWHMVDIRIYDRYEAYDLQYQRLIYAIQKLKLGYVVSETWNRELSTFSEPIGTYGIRLLTFMEPLQLKKMLIGLEYGREDGRIVDLDISWHGKQISWKNLLDDKSVRKDIKELSSFFPKSNFFAIQNEKAALIDYCVKNLTSNLKEEEQSVMREMERQIRTRKSE